MKVNTKTITITVDASGDGTDYIDLTSEGAGGRILSIHYTVTGTPFLEPSSPTSGFDFTITTETTLQNLWVETGITGAKTVAPRQSVNDTVGVATFYNDDGDEPVVDFVYAANERIKIVVANAGNATTGTFRVIWG